MAINIKGFNEKGDIIGDVLPEYIPPSLIEEIKREKEINSITDGYSPDRTMRKIGSIPAEMYYNYPMYKGVPPTQHDEFWSADNGRNLITCLEEFPVLKTVENPL